MQLTFHDVVEETKSAVRSARNRVIFILKSYWIFRCVSRLSQFESRILEVEIKRTSIVNLSAFSQTLK